MRTENKMWRLSKQYNGDKRAVNSETLCSARIVYPPRNSRERNSGVWSTASREICVYCFFLPQTSASSNVKTCHLTRTGQQTRPVLN